MAIGFSQNFAFERTIIANLSLAYREKNTYSRTELMSKLGVGDNKAEAMVTWLGKLFLRDNRKKNLTAFGKKLIEFDPYFEHLVTQWLLHYQLAKNRDAEIWYFLANKFVPRKERFFSEEALDSLKLAEIGERSPKHLRSDVRIYLNAFTDTKGLKDINYLNKIGRNSYRKGSPRGLDPLLIAYILFDQRNENYPEVKTVSITELLTADGNAAKVCLLNRENLEKFLYQLQGMGYLVVSKFADLDQVAFKFEGDPLEILEEYYNSLK